MGLIAMSERDLQRIEILSKVVAGRMTMVSAAHVLDLSERQVRRLLERIRTGGAASIRHKAIGRPSNNRISDGVRDYAVTLVHERYADFGPTLAAEKLAERDGLHVSRETLRSWMSEAGLWLSRKQRRTFHRPRMRREAYGELVQIDVCGRPGKCKQNLSSVRACGRVLTCVRPRIATSTRRGPL
ncbi:helix-turn-helix domain-containing protein, partial [Pararhizobium sp. DWP3-4]|uniref:helix-turn-helix domain-containing protein n=1 Tax=Pararhizobium sp. DWP3-4 TaxID=2804565 RepID=UPI003CF735C3